MRFICARCSLGSPHEHHGADVNPLWQTTRRFGFAGPRSDVVGLLEGWSAGGEGRAFGEPFS